MKRSILAVALVAGFVASQADAQTNVYRWVDKDGNVHFSDAPPAEDTKNLTQKRMGGGGDVDETQLPFATQIAMKRFPVTLYTSADCGDYCAQGRALLQSRGVPYAEKNAATAAEAENVKKLIGVLEVPVLLVGDKPVRGFGDELWHSALDGAGYARTKLPGQQNPRAPEPVTAPPPAQPQAEAPK